MTTLSTPATTTAATRQNYCKPCWDRGKPFVPATEFVGSEPWCKACFNPTSGDSARQGCEGKEAATSKIGEYMRQGLTREEARRLVVKEYDVKRAEILSAAAVARKAEMRKKRHALVSQAVEMATKACGMTAEQIGISNARSDLNVSDCRALVYLVANELFGVGIAHIGQATGRDHSTVYKQMLRAKANDKIMAKLEAIKAEVEKATLP